VSNLVQGDKIVNWYGVQVLMLSITTTCAPSSAFRDGDANSPVRARPDQSGEYAQALVMVRSRTGMPRPSARLSGKVARLFKRTSQWVWPRWEAAAKSADR
jgi:hypothetical protein